MKQLPSILVSFQSAFRADLANYPLACSKLLALMFLQRLNTILFFFSTFKLLNLNTNKFYGHDWTLLSHINHQRCRSAACVDTDPFGACLAVQLPISDA